MGIENCNKIASFLYKSYLGKRITVVSYTGKLSNGDDIVALCLSDYTNKRYPLITNDHMDKCEDMRALQTTEHYNYRIIPRLIN